MKTSAQMTGTLVIVTALFALTLVPMASTMRALTAARDVLRARNAES